MCGGGGDGVGGASAVGAAVIAAVVAAVVGVVVSEILLIEDEGMLEKKKQYMCIVFPPRSLIS